MLVKDAIALVRSLLKSNNTDSLLTNKYIYNLLVMHSEQVLLKYLEGTNTISNPELYQTISGLETKEVDMLSELACFDDLDECYTFKIRRTIKKIPSIRSIAGKYLIMSVSSIDGSVKYSQTNVSSVGRMFTSYYSRFIKSKYYFIHDNYIWITDDIDMISITASFKDPVDAYRCSCDSSCINNLDAPISIPSNLVSEVVAMAVSSIMQSGNIQKDSEADDKKNLFRPS